MPSIYLQQGKRFVEMQERPYEAERLLQALLADHPELLSEDGARLLLVRREAALSEPSEGIAAGWLDHLFLDDRAVPVLVEVKRSSDARLRRDVVGQMLDYAANAAACWPSDRLRAWFAETCRAEDPDAAVLAAFANVEDPEAYWADVQTNLQAGRMRLVFVADMIPPHLRRIVEFLDRQMQQAEVLAVEVKQYVDERDEVQTLVPRVLGQTEAARQAKRRRAAERWDHERILHKLRERHPSELAAAAEALFGWARERRLDEWFGAGSKDGSWQAGIQRGSRYLWPFALYTYGRVEIHFQYLARRPPFEAVGLREELRRRLNDVPGIQIDETEVELRPSFPLSVLADSAARERFCSTIEWALAQVPAERP